jgi:uncharacterized protein YneF (UPF0154 family)
VTFVSTLRELWKHKVLVILAVIIALAAAVLAVYQVSVSPPSVSKNGTVEARGSSEILIDSARSPIAGSKRDISGLISRAGVFARLMGGGDVVAQIAEDAGVSPKEVDVAGPSPLPGEAPGISEAAETLPYGLSFTEVPELPIVSVTTRAPTVREAAALAAAAPEALRGVITSVQKQQETPATERVEVRVLGPAQAKLEDEAPGAKMAAAIFFVVLALELGLILGIPRLVAAWRREDFEEAELAEAPDISEAAATLLVPNNGRTESHHDRPGRVRQH